MRGGTARAPVIYQERSGQLGWQDDDQRDDLARVRGSDWPATPADRLAQLCRHHGVELGLATDGRWWALVWAPTGGVTTVAVFDAISWPDLAERTVVRAFLSLLERRRFFAVPAERRLPALLRESLNNQEEITDRLGVQVRQAVELLVAAFGRAGLGAEVAAHEVYRGGRGDGADRVPAVRRVPSTSGSCPLLRRRSGSSVPRCDVRGQ